MFLRSNKSFLFKGDDEIAKIKAGEIKEMPDWIVKTDLFKFAKKDGDILVIANKKDKIKAENEEDLTPAEK